MLWEADLSFGKLIFVLRNCYVLRETFFCFGKWIRTVNGLNPRVTCNIVV